MLKLNNLSSPKGANKNTKRLGRGQASGQGTQAGKGHKGQKARSGGGVRTGFEGGSMPLYMRLPKRGFSNFVHAKKVVTVSLSQIELHHSDLFVSRDSLVKFGLIKKKDSSSLVKVLQGKKSLEKSFEFSSELIYSSGAKKALADAKCTIRK